MSLFLSWEWKFFTKNKISQYFDNFVWISLICVKVRRFALFNSSITSAISSVQKYNLVNIVTIIVNCFSVSMFVFLRFSIKNKKRNSAFDFVRFSISKLFDVVFYSIFFDVVFFSIFFNVVFSSIFSTFFDVEFVFSARFFVSSSSSYRDSFFVCRFCFFSKVSQKKSYALFHFSINLKRKNVKYFSNFWKIQIR